MSGSICALAAQCHWVLAIEYLPLKNRKEGFLS
jgi:hypothetical protein